MNFPWNCLFNVTANSMPESSGTNTRDFMCFFLFWLISLPAIWFPIHQMCAAPVSLNFNVHIYEKHAFSSIAVTCSHSSPSLHLSLVSRSSSGASSRRRVLALLSIDPRRCMEVNWVGLWSSVSCRALATWLLLSRVYFSSHFNSSVIMIFWTCKLTSIARVGMPQILLLALRRQALPCGLSYFQYPLHFLLSASLAS